MPIIAEEYQLVIAVDTHAASHVFAVVTAVNGAVVSQDEFPATSAGVSRAAAWVEAESAPTLPASPCQSPCRITDRSNRFSSQ
jgi:hypothetical protein